MLKGAMHGFNNDALENIADRTMTPEVYNVHASMYDHREETDNFNMSTKVTNVYESMYETLKQP